MQGPTSALALAGLLLTCATAQAQADPPQVAEASPARLVRALTPVEIEIAEELSSKTAKIDAFFRIRLAAPIMEGDRIVVPAGTPGVGQVVHAAKSGYGGKAGELIVAARYLEIGSVRLPLRRFRLGAAGDHRSGEAFAASMVVPFGGMFVSGGEVTFPAGMRASAIVAADTELAPE